MSPKQSRRYSEYVIKSYSIYELNIDRYTTKREAKNWGAHKHFFPFLYWVGFKSTILFCRLKATQFLRGVQEYQLYSELLENIDVGKGVMKH